MPSLADQLKDQAGAILDELVERARDELKGTLYEEMLRRRILRARYANVLEVLTDYVGDQYEALFRQHHIIIFMQRFYLDIDEENPLNPRLINWRAQEIHRSVQMYFDVLKRHAGPDHHAAIDRIHADVDTLVEQLRTYLSDHVDRFAGQIPRVKLAGIDYAPCSTFDIDPQHWP